MRATTLVLQLNWFFVFTFALAQDATPATTTSATTQPGVTVVNMHLKQALPEDVFFMLGKQVGLKFASNGNNIWDQESMQVPMDVDFTDRPFWSAVREACAMWHITMQNNYDGGRRITVMAQSARNGGESFHAPPYFETQGFVVEAVGFNQSLSYSSPAGASCNVQLRMYVDPALRVQSFNGAANVVEAADNAGHSMLPDQRNNIYYGGMQQRTSVFECSVPLKYPPENAGKRIAHLKCILQLRAGDKMDTLSVDDPLKAGQTTKEFGDTRVTFKSLKKQGSSYELKITISRTDDDGRRGGGGNDWQLIQQSMQLLDAMNRPYGTNGGGGGGSRNGIYNYTVSYSASGGEDGPTGDPAKWVVELPMNTHVMRVPVEFTDLPMP
jgi:hypothetical protein